MGSFVIIAAKGAKPGPPQVVCQKQHDVRLPVCRESLGSDERQEGNYQVGTHKKETMDLN